MSNSTPMESADRCDVAPLLREPLTPDAAAQMASTLKALADPVRLRLFSAIASRAGGEACVCDISDGIDVKQPTISHHLKVLRDAGLLTSQRRASWVYYAVAPEALRSLAMLFAIDTLDATAGANA
ncbi:MULTISPECIES: ArsR/SmtB family transcription factor [Mycolicibacterium]|uniref:ArsR/SmtB family transcription factor n=1 Tax=Mycolicibacterium monacense TaxID=85693 RepID=UPI0007E9F435|nr:metalloregulator ArsR/SmtB family transcription factor [Mycolicibacterium monacense]OBB77601.1 transcriptional regulator [Mycolicibacterium monacense]